MQNKNILIVFASLLVLATLYTLSFTYFSKKFEAKAVEYGEVYADSLENAGALGERSFEQAQKEGAQKFLETNMETEAYPVLGHTYKYVKEHELNLGLDLQGMSVTLTVDYQKWLESKAGSNATDSVFMAVLEETNRLNKVDGNSADYITNFETAWNAESHDGDATLSELFQNYENSDFVPDRAKDVDVFNILKDKAKQAVNSSEEVIRRRIDALGVAQPNIQKLDNGRILVDLPGIGNPERARKQLRATANLEFWRVHDGLKSRDKINQIDPAIAQLIRNPQARRAFGIGQFSVKDVPTINAMLDRSDVQNQLTEFNERIYWSASSDSGHVELYYLYSGSLNDLSSGAELTGEVITEATATRDRDSQPVVNMSMNSTGAAIWSTMTEACANEGQRPVAVVMDGLVYSAPSVNQKFLAGARKYPLAEARRCLRRKIWPIF